MKHLGTKEIETSRLLLRRFNLEDASAVFRNWTSDPEVTTFLTWPTHRSEQDALDWCRFNVDRYGELDHYNWLLQPKDAIEPVGSISVVRLDDRIHSAHIGYVLGRAWWGQGYMTEALEAVIQYLFEEVGMNRIDSRHDPRNPGSGRVMEKAGMLFEGLCREADWNNLGICDYKQYAILRRDYGGVVVAD